MMDSVGSFVVQQLVYQAPVMLVCLAGVVAGFVFVKRMPAAAMTCVIGCALLVVTALATTAAQALFIRTQTVAGIGQGMTMIAIAGSVVRAIGLGAIVAAVFIGRHRAPGGDPFVK